MAGYWLSNQGKGVVSTLSNLQRLPCGGWQAGLKSKCMFILFLQFCM